jgi:hypothetical protein
MQEDRMKCLDTWLIATLAGAATMVVWGGISHLGLLKGIGFTRMSNEERIVSTLRPSLPGDGLSCFPRLDRRGNPTGEEQAAWEARFRAGPPGMILYHAAGDAPVSPKKLSVQCLSAVLAAGMVSYWLSLAIATYWRRVGPATLLESFVLFLIIYIYWNFYRFPNAFFLAQGVDMIVGWSLAGAVIAKRIPPAQI